MEMQLSMKECVEDTFVSKDGATEIKFPLKRKACQVIE